MVENLIANTRFSIQFVLDKIGVLLPSDNLKQPPQQQSTATTAAAAEELSRTALDGLLDGFDATDIGNGRALTSRILRLSLRWKGPAKRAELPTSIIMKVYDPQRQMAAEEKEERKKATMDGNTTADQKSEVAFIECLTEAHRREINFYAFFRQLDPALRVPKFYYGSDYRHPPSPSSSASIHSISAANNIHHHQYRHREGLILLEDLTSRAITVPVLPGFSDAQVLELLTELARLHSISWQHPEWEQHVIGEGNNTQIREEFIRVTWQNAEKLSELDTSIGALICRVRPLFTVASHAMSNYSGIKYGFPASIVHGDLWAANALWALREEQQQQQNGSRRPLCAIIDWQTVHAGNCCEDIHRVLSLNTSAGYRRQNMPRLLEFYACQVAECMNKYDGKGMPFTMDQLKDACKHAMPFSMMYLCYGVPKYHEMDSVVGKQANDLVEQPGARRNQREQNQRELLQRCRLFMEDTADAFAL